MNIYTKNISIIHDLCFSTAMRARKHKASFILHVKSLFVLSRMEMFREWKIFLRLPIWDLNFFGLVYGYEVVGLRGEGNPNGIIIAFLGIPLRLCLFVFYQSSCFSFLRPLSKVDVEVDSLAHRMMFSQDGTFWHYTRWDGIVCTAGGKVFRSSCLLFPLLSKTKKIRTSRWEALLSKAQWKQSIIMSTKIK